MEPKKEAPKVPRRNLEYGHLGLDARFPSLDSDARPFQPFSGPNRNGSRVSFTSGHQKTWTVTMQ